MQKLFFIFPECLQLDTVSSIFNIASAGAISCYTRLISSTLVLWHHVFYGCLLFYFDADCGKCFSGRHSRRKYYFSQYLCIYLRQTWRDMHERTYLCCDISLPTDFICFCVSEDCTNKLTVYLRK